ncbi:unnamed protein product [Fusarium equiseti]|uniref:Rhodopsin domain-containing protein n=1 Tax=Fusarium equiseti TaxID=61235 RepID=A0A8J2NMB6_FUSEQ|nr:unnamed protein product [Fusarium equiseti]
MRNPDAKDILASQILVFVAIALVAARLNLRLRIQKRKLLLSDKLMVAACTSGVIAGAFGPAFAALGAFEPNVYSALQGYSGGTTNLKLVLKLLFASNFPFYTTLYLCKAALLDLRIQRTCSPWTYAVTFNVGWGLSFLGDLLVFILPWLIVPALNVKRSLRIVIYFTFLLGSVNMAVSLGRFVTIFKAGADSTISLAEIVLWSALDVDIGLVIACLPSLRPYFGSRHKSENSSPDDTNGNWIRRNSRLGLESIRHNYKQHDKEGSLTYTGRQSLRRPSLWSEIEGASDAGKELFTDATDIELIEMKRPSEALIVDSDSGKKV